MPFSDYSSGDGKWLGPDGKEVKAFPVQIPYKGDPRDRTVPWPVAEEAYKEYSALFGTSQSLERLAERHGFGVAELALLLFERIRRLRSQRKALLDACKAVAVSPKDGDDHIVVSSKDWNAFSAAMSSFAE